MSATDFLPRSAADLVNWSAAFNNQINATPVVFGLTAAQAADYNVKHNSFVAAYTLAVARSTRGPSKTVAKNAAMRILRSAARQLAKIIRAQPNVTNVQRSDLGLTINNPGGRSPRVPRPRTAPFLNVTPLEDRRVLVRLRDPGEPTKRGKPTGVTSAMIFMHVGDTPPAEPSEWKLLDTATRIKHSITLPVKTPLGATIWLTARWQNPRGEAGPTAKPVYTFMPMQLGAANAQDEELMEPAEAKLAA